VWIWTAATLVLAVVAGVLWRGSDAAATEHTTAPATHAPAGTPADQLEQRWSAAAALVPRPVVESGRVIVGSAHGIRALDPATGTEVWHYSRSNAHLCGLTAVDGRVVAVYRAADRCDEVVAFAADTGVYAWTRNVDFQPDITLTSTSGIVLAASTTGLVAIDPIGDNIRWDYQAPDGCRLTGAVPGSAGVAVLQTCAGGAAPQLRLLDGFSGGPHWTRDVAGNDVTLAGADAVVTVVVGNSLQALSRTDGSVLTTAALGEATADRTPLEAAVADVVLVWARGTLVALSPSAGTVLWQQPALGLPVTRIDLKDAAAATGLLVPEVGGFVRRDPSTGADQGRSTVAGDLPAGGTSEQVGAAVVYALAGRVTGYR
jgi:outer membrane protein assembly factor BamB